MFVLRRGDVPRRGVMALSVAPIDLFEDRRTGLGPRGELGLGDRPSPERRRFMLL